MGFCLNLGAWGDIFAVPKEVVDNHIKLANVMQIKTLLYVLRHSSEEITVEEIAQALSKHPDDISDSLQYWVENKIIAQRGEQLFPSEEVREAPADKAKSASESGQNEEKKDSEKNITRLVSRPQKPDSVFLAKRINESEQIKTLMREAETILAKPISTSDSATLLMLHDTDGLPVDVILMLIQYAVSINKNNMRYIEKLGLNWADKEIDSIKRAEEEIKSLDETMKSWKTLVSIMGVDYHSPTANEKRFAARWINEWKFSSDMIREAYERCVDNTGKVRLSYINKILDSWNKNGVRNIEEAQLEKKKKTAGKKKPEKSVSYDIEEYENSSIFDD